VTARHPLRLSARIDCGRRFRPIAARQYSRAVAQDHQPLGIIFDRGLIERARNSKTMVLHKNSLDAGALAALAKEFDAVPASHRTTLTDAKPGAYPGREISAWPLEPGQCPCPAAGTVRTSRLTPPHPTRPRCAFFRSPHRRVLDGRRHLPRSGYGRSPVNRLWPQDYPARF
jgi:hypothetical protein